MKNRLDANMMLSAGAIISTWGLLDLMSQGAPQIFAF